MAKITALTLALGMALTVLAAGPVLAADPYQTRYAAPYHPPYFGRFEPWSRTEERPPRKGRWYYAAPLPPAVNYLVPLAERYRYVRPAPFTPAWYAYCEQRWPSFDPESGTIRTPDGVRMCQ